MQNKGQVGRPVLQSDGQRLNARRGAGCAIGCLLCGSVAAVETSSLVMNLRFCVHVTIGTEHDRNLRSWSRSTRTF